MAYPPRITVQPDLFPFEDNRSFNSRPIAYHHISKIETNEVDCAGENGSVYLDSPSSPDSVDSMTSCKRKRQDLRVYRTPLPYLIQPRKKPDELIGFDLYNEIFGSLSDTDGSDCSQDDEDDKDYIIVDNVESSANSKEVTRVSSDNSGLVDTSSVSSWVSDEHSAEQVGTMNDDNLARFPSPEDIVDQHDAGDADSDESDWVIVE